MLQYNSSMEMVEEFHEIFNLPVNDKPFINDEKLNNMRISLLKEEVRELEEALKNKDKVEVLDALSDIQYVLDGAYLSLGFYKVKQAALEEVQRSNLSKLDENGKPIYREDGKVLKGPAFFKPNIRQFVDSLENS